MTKKHLVEDTEELEDQVETEGQEVEEDEDETIDESPASETLHPGAGANGGTASRTQVLASIAGALASVDREKANYWEKVLKTNFKDSFGTDESEHTANKNSIKAYASDAIGKSVKEDVADMFNGQNDLTEDFKAKATVLFEAAVNAKVNAVLVEAEDLYEERLEEETAAIAEAITDKVEQFIGYVAEQWMTDNEVAIESALRSEVTSDFMSKLRDLFIESNVNIPEESVEVVDALAEKVEELEARLAEQIEENAELREGQEEATRESIIAQAIDGMNQVQKEKVTKLAESLDADDAEDFAAKVDVLVESVKAPSNKAGKDTVQELLEDVDPNNVVLMEADGSVIADAVPEEMKAYIGAINRTVPKAA